MQQQTKQRVNWIMLSWLLCAAFVGPVKSQALAQIPPKAPTIVALSPHIVELLFAIGAGEQIIGVSEFADYPKAAQQLPRVGNYLSLQIEKIVMLKPDLIVAWRSGTPSKDLEKLAEFGFRIAYSDPKTFDDIATDARILGRLTGHEQQAEQVAHHFINRLVRIKQQYQQKTLLNGFYQLSAQPLMTVAQQSWPQQFLSICRVNNPFYHNAVAYPIVNIEQLLQADIQLIIVPTLDKPDVAHWQQWPIIPAVAHQQFIFPNADKMHRQTLRAIDELDHFCQQVDKVRQFYQRFTPKA
jgi:vitamin B12 transport system substrate-binding protein